jgi:hypothetical protein
MATTTPNYGWDVPTSTDYVKDGATAIETLGDDIDATLWTALGGAYPGLRLIKKQTIGSGVSSVSVTNAFSATYEAYKIVITGGAASTNANLSFALTGSTSGYYIALMNSQYNNTAPVNSGLSNTSSWAFSNAFSTTFLNFNMEVFNPFLAKQTLFNSAYISPTNIGFGGGYHDVATSYSGFTIATASGTITGGTIYVYGYGAS